MKYYEKGNRVTHAEVTESETRVLRREAGRHFVRRQVPMVMKQKRVAHLEAQLSKGFINEED